MGLIVSALLLIKCSISGRISLEPNKSHDTTRKSSHKRLEDIFIHDLQLGIRIGSRGLSYKYVLVLDVDRYPETGTAPTGEVPQCVLCIVVLLVI